MLNRYERNKKNFFKKRKINFYIKIILIFLIFLLFIILK